MRSKRSPGSRHVLSDKTLWYKQFLMFTDLKLCHGPAECKWYYPPCLVVHHPELGGMPALPDAGCMISAGSNLVPSLSQCQRAWSRSGPVFVFFREGASKSLWSRVTKTHAGMTSLHTHINLATVTSRFLNVVLATAPDTCTTLTCSETDGLGGQLPRGLRMDNHSDIGGTTTHRHHQFVSPLSLSSPTTAGSNSIVDTLQQHVLLRRPLFEDTEHRTFSPVRATSSSVKSIQDIMCQCSKVGRPEG